MKKLQISLLLSYLLFSAFALFAQPEPPKEGPLKAMHEEVRAYTENTILPVLREERNALDQQLSATDRATLADLRAQLEEHREASKTFKEFTREAWEEGTLTDQQKIQMVDLKLEKRSIMDQVHQIAQANEESLRAIHDKLEPQQKEWQEALKVIHEKYQDDIEKAREERRSNRPEGKPGKGKGERPGAGKGHGHGHKGKGGEGGKPFGPGMGQLREPVHFLLWDTSKPLPREREDVGDGIMAYPNPSGGLTSIEFEVPTEGQVTVTLIDPEGNEVQELFKGTKSAGVHTVQFETQSLDNGVYFYKVSTPKGSSTKRLVIRK
jgi:hypothetical protein